MPNSTIANPPYRQIYYQDCNEIHSLQAQMAFVAVRSGERSPYAHLLGTMTTLVMVIV